jgi:transcriptional regulator with XRE-family HTH domain
VVLSGDDSQVPAEPTGTRIAKRRHVLGLSQEELAERVGVTRDAVSAWERGKHFPHRHLGKLEAVLGISLSDDGTAGQPRDVFEERLLQELPPERAWAYIRAYRDEVQRQAAARELTG